MINKLMSKKPLPEDEDEFNLHMNILDTYIKILLSCCHQFSKSYYTAEVAKFLFGKTNFISFFNLPHQIVKFGPLGLY